MLHASDMVSEEECCKRLVDQGGEDKEQARAAEAGSF